MIVADTNIIAYLFIAGERTSHAERVLRKDCNWIAPLLWRSEFRSAVTFYLRKGFLSLLQALQICEEAELFMRGGEYEVTSAQVMSLVTQSRCSASDCEFVALAKELGLALVTTDQKILGEFPSIAIRPEDF